jgi:arylamine N-acetyltransferase
MKSGTFSTYSGGAVFEKPKLPLQEKTKCPHTVLFVQIPGDNSGTTWVVDVAFGGRGLVRPIALSEEESNVVTGTTPTELHRLRKIPTPEGEDGSTQWWRFQICHTTKEEGWTSGYIFPEAPFYLSDFQEASLLLNTLPYSTLFWWCMTAIKYFPVDLTTGQTLTSEEARRNDPTLSSVHYGRYTLVGDVVKKVIGSQTEILSTVKSERERIELLGKYFGIVYSLEDEKHIKGRDAAIGSGFVPPLAAN